MPFAQEADDEEDDAIEAPVSRQVRRKDARDAGKARKAKTTRETELSERPGILKQCLDTYREVEKGYADQRQRADDTLDYWDLYDCKLGEHQFYSGNSKIFVPIVNNAVEARKTRFTNQLFPQSGRNVEVTTNEENLPQATESLLETYVTKSCLRTQVVPALCVAGDIEGQYTIYTGWRETKRHVASRVKEPVQVDIGGVGHDVPGDDVETIKEETIVEGAPYAEVVPDADLLVLPQTVDSIQEAFDAGGSVTVLRRWTQGAIKRMMKDGDIDDDAGKTLLKTFSSNNKTEQADTKRKLAEAAGVKTGDGAAYALVYETWAMLKVDGKLRLCRIYFGGSTNVLGCKLCPYWNDRCPIISAPVVKTPGVFKGIAPVSRVLDMQVLANDAVNEGADTAHFSAMPIIMTDPEKSPQVGTMILGLASVWLCDPNSTKFAEFPKLWDSMFQLVGSAKSEIFQTLNVNPSMVPSDGGGSSSGKQNQAEVANQQQVDILTTADAVTNIEQAILSPLLQIYADYDHQFRDKAQTVRMYGEFGLKANMQELPPLQAGNRYVFRWLGVEAARNAAQMQNQISMMNVLRGIPPALYPGYRLNLTPVIVQMVESAFGPRLAPLVFEDITDQLTTDPQIENDLLSQGFECVVHPGDNDIQHMQQHIALLRTLTPGTAPFTETQGHIIRHQGAMQAKAKAMQAQQGPQPGVPGEPAGAAGAGAGLPGMGAQVGAPQTLDSPNGTIPQDQMGAASAVVMPRQM